jgi:hypothetical protein
MAKTAFEIAMDEHDAEHPEVLKAQVAEVSQKSYKDRGADRGETDFDKQLRLTAQGQYFRNSMGRMVKYDFRASSERRRK